MLEGPRINPNSLHFGRVFTIFILSLFIIYFSIGLGFHFTDPNTRKYDCGNGRTFVTKDLLNSPPDKGCTEINQPQFANAMFMGFFWGPLMLGRIFGQNGANSGAGS